jgi:hypothetical protein
MGPHSIADVVPALFWEHPPGTPSLPGAAQSALLLGCFATARRLGQRSAHSRAIWRATYPPSSRTRDESVEDPALPSGRGSRPAAPCGCARDTLRVRKRGRHLPRTAGAGDDPLAPRSVPQRSGGTARHTIPARYLRSGQVCPAGRAGVRSACTVPHTVPLSFREAHVGRFLASFQGSRTKSRRACGSIPAEGPRRGKRSGRGCSESLAGVGLTPPWSCEAPQSGP